MIDVAALNDIFMRVDGLVEEVLAQADADYEEPLLLAQLALKASTAPPEVWDQLDRLRPGAREAIISKFTGGG